MLRRHNPCGSKTVDIGSRENCTRQVSIGMDAWLTNCPRWLIPDPAQSEFEFTVMTRTRRTASRTVELRRDGQFVAVLPAASERQGQFDGVGGPGRRNLRPRLN